MVTFLSDEWLRAVDEALRTSTGVAAVAPRHPIVVQHNVVDGPDGTTAYHLVLGADDRRAVAGAAARPDVTFTLDTATAIAVASGRRNAAASVLTGCLRTGGDLRAVLEHRALFAAVDEALAPVRAATTYAEP